MILNGEYVHADVVITYNAATAEAAWRWLRDLERKAARRRRMARKKRRGWA